MVAVGRLKAGPERDLCQRYDERLRPLLRQIGISDLRIIELYESSQRRPDDRRKDEALAIRAALPQHCALILLDESGRSEPSEAFAALIQDHRAAGAGDLAFAIGGPDGNDETLRAAAAATLCFGRMTLPHQLVRVLLLEQIYRAGTILTGHPYHRA